MTTKIRQEINLIAYSVLAVAFLFFFLFVFFKTQVNLSSNENKIKILKDSLSSEKDGLKSLYITEEIIKLYLEDKKKTELINFLSSEITEDGNKYKSYYFFLIAELYYKEGLYKIALLNYKDALSYQDLFYESDSIHLKSILKILELEDDLLVKGYYYKFLIDNIYNFYYDSEDKMKKIANIYYDYTVFLKNFGDYKQVYVYYEKILDIYKNEYRGILSEGSIVNYVEGVPSYFYEVKESYDFYKSSKDWVEKDINKLLAKVRSSIINGNPELLLSYSSKSDFFAKTSTQDSWDYNARSERYKGLITYLLRHRSIYVSSTINDKSTSKEVYLKTYGWGNSLNEWYFYFRKVDYPLDSKIDGGWEWAGIYLGKIF